MLRLSSYLLSLLLISPAMAMDIDTPHDGSKKRSRQENNFPPKKCRKLNESDLNLTATQWLPDEIWGTILRYCTEDLECIKNVRMTGKQFYRVMDSICQEENQKHGFVGWQDRKGFASLNPGRIYLENYTTYCLLSFYPRHYLNIQGIIRLEVDKEDELREEFAKYYNTLPGTHPASEVFSYVNTLLNNDELHRLSEKTEAYIHSDAALHNPLLMELQGIRLTQRWQGCEEDFEIREDEREKWENILNRLATTPSHFGLSAVINCGVFFQFGMTPIRNFLSNYCEKAANNEQFLPILIFLNEFEIKLRSHWAWLEVSIDLDKLQEQPRTLASHFLTALENKYHQPTIFTQEMAVVLQAVPEAKPYFLMHFPEITSS